MLLYRLTKLTYANDLSGAGAKAYGGRWNNKGNAMLYLASSRSLAILEVLVHLPVSIIPDNYCMITVDVPEDTQDFDSELLPDDWTDSPEDYNLKKIGDRFLSQNKNLSLKVPSSIVREEFNYLVNPLYIMASKISIVKIEPFNFDKRLVQLKIAQ